MKLVGWLLFFSISIFHSPLKAQDSLERLSIDSLTRNYFIYTTYNQYQQYRIPAHGMYVVTDQGVLLLDTPWDTTQFQPLLDSIFSRHRLPVKWCIVTHWHNDRTAGLEYYRRSGIKTFSTGMTDSLCQVKNYPRAEVTFNGDTIFNFAGLRFETFYPGQGHTMDNIVIWFEKERVLYGGCLIKGVEAKDLGYLGDANVREYETTLRKVRNRYARPRFIIVSHHDWKSSRALNHSIRLAIKLKKTNR